MKNKNHPLTFFREAQEARNKNFRKFQGDKNGSETTLDVNKISKDVKEGIELIQRGKEGGGGQEALGRMFYKLAPAQQDSVIKFQKAKLIYPKNKNKNK